MLYDEMNEEENEDLEDGLEEQEEAEDKEALLDRAASDFDFSLHKKEPDRPTYEFTLKDDERDYKGKVAKKLSEGTYIFILEDQKFKKVNIEKISTILQK